MTPNVRAAKVFEMYLAIADMMESIPDGDKRAVIEMFYGLLTDLFREFG